MARAAPKSLKSLNKEARSALFKEVESEAMREVALKQGFSGDLRPNLLILNKGTLRVLSATFILSKNSRVLDAKSRRKSANLG